jgi:hypothetical protein
MEHGSAGPTLIVSQQARPPVAGLSFAAARANPPRDSSKIGMGFCKPTIIRLMTMWADLV